MRAPPVTRIPSEELRFALEEALSGHFGRRCRIQRLRRRRSVYSSTYTIENLEVELARGRRLSLVFKNLSPSSLLEAAQEVRPRFLYNPLREIETYRSILDPQRFGTPICYGALYHPGQQRYWLFLERVRGPLLWQVGEMETWRQAAQWMARLHTEFELRGKVPRPAKFAHLLTYDRRFLGVWASRAEDFLRKGAGEHTAKARRQFSRLVNGYERLIDRLLALPQTLIHGEFYPSNIILRQAGQEHRICPIDWEAAALGPSLMDLAALTSGDWNSDQKQDLVTAYREALVRVNGWPPPLPELMELVECCQLHLAMQWLGWATDWSPPKMHARNWLDEVFRLAERVGL